jgi:hypothetical protein
LLPAKYVCCSLNISGRVFYTDMRALADALT